MQPFIHLTKALLAIPNFYDSSNSLPKSSRLKYSQRKPSQVSQLILHHSASDGMTVYDIAAMHVRDKKWPAIGYHIVIDKDGTAYLTNPLSAQSYHCKGHNFKSIGICINANSDIHHITEPAERMLCMILTTIACNFHELSVYGHKELGQTACPGSFFPLVEMKAHYSETKEVIASI